MNIGILGTAGVARALGEGFVKAGHRVMIGGRSADNAEAKAWAEGLGIGYGTFADAARFGEIVFNAVKGIVGVESVEQAGAANLKGKILVDLSNPLDFSNGMPPSLTVANTDSIGEQIQRKFPEVRVVKALNTLNLSVMLAPQKLSGPSDLFIAGDDAAAKAEVVAFLKSFGWETIHDLGGIIASRGLEMAVVFWASLYGKIGHGTFNFRIVL